MSPRLLTASVAGVWLATALLVLVPGYRLEGELWLARLGLGPLWMWAACAGELALGVAVLVMKPRTWLVGLQTALVLFFTATLASLEPMLLVHPLGVLSKNLPLLAVLWTAWLVEREGPSVRARWLLRLGMAVIWFTEGLFPKLLFQQVWELDLAVALGIPFPEQFVGALGLLQIASAALALTMGGRALRLVLGVQLAALLLLPLMVCALEPAWLWHPFGPITKNLPLLVGTWVLWRTSS